VSAFTPQSEAGGNKRATLHNPQVEHKKFFDEILRGDRKQSTIVNYGMLLRHQLQIEFASRSAFSSPSKASIIRDSGQYFYREFFTKLITPITRGYKISEKHSRYSSYSFYAYTKWLYTFIQQRYLKKQRDQLYAVLKEALGALHGFFLRLINISTTSFLSIKSVDSPRVSPLGESRERLSNFLQTLFNFRLDPDDAT
jgi:hypothetical protein